MSDIMNGWYFTGGDGQRVGPVEADSLRDMIRRKAIDGSAYVWTAAFGPDWRQLSTTDLWQEMGGTPALPTNMIDSKAIWLLAVMPVIYVVAKAAYVTWAMNAGAHLTDGDQLLPLLGLWIANGLVADWDIRAIRRTGNPTASLGWAFLLVPVYIWQRNSRLRVSQASFIVWLVLIIMTLPF